jgi:hypothetical protein
VPTNQSEGSRHRRSEYGGFDRESWIKVVPEPTSCPLPFRRVSQGVTVASLAVPTVELDAVAVALREATRRVEAMQVEVRPYRITRQLVGELIDQMTGLVEHALFETRVVWRQRWSRAPVGARRSLPDPGNGDPVEKRPVLSVDRHDQHRGHHERLGADR